MLARRVSMEGGTFIVIFVLLALFFENHLVVLIQKTFRINKKPANILAIIIMVLVARWLVLTVGVPVINYIEALTGWTFR